MDYGTSEIVGTMAVAIGIGVGIGYLIWGPPLSFTGGSGETGTAKPAEDAATSAKAATPPVAREPAPQKVPAADAQIAAVAAPVDAPVASDAAGEAPAPTPEAGPASASGPASAPANLFESRPDHVDDLQKIKGIGPKMEGLLNARGVFQYAQLAAFTEADLAWLDDATGSFPGRAARDEWVSQAQALAQG
ncbi:MAG: hypothetical protein ACFBRM_07705 [Pikeienuella sp.]